ncbi:variable surface protein [Plasmodium gonderi]|uniref:Variable surface protein n=1 Tax=Plasmodium gonderi TaxID=77519 RepID=A0A1Y1JUD7_PLAGO|nr:variable surface protein [Plasmodium gonderi]GAW84362.1 variable surface protein [Plasmodium gonderi]
MYHSIIISNILMEVGCKYLYSWIYYELKSNNKNEHTKTLYDRVTNKYGIELTGIQFCKDYKEEINDEQMFKLSFLNELYKCHNDMHDIIKNRKDEVICEALKNILNEYKTKFEERVAVKETTENIKSSVQSIPTYKNNIKAAIITTIIVMLLIFLFIFLVFKFASNSSYFQQKLQRMRNKWKNIDIVCSILKQSEINRNISWNNRYNISYNID